MGANSSASPLTTLLRWEAVCSPVSCTKQTIHTEQMLVVSSHFAAQGDGGMREAKLLHEDCNLGIPTSVAGRGGGSGSGSGSGSTTCADARTTKREAGDMASFREHGTTASADAPRQVKRRCHRSSPAGWQGCRIPLPGIGAEAPLRTQCTHSAAGTHHTAAHHVVDHALC